MRILPYVVVLLVMVGCAKPSKQIITIDTKPQGATISIASKDDATGIVTKKEIGQSPVDYEIILPKFSSQSSDMDDPMGDISVQVKINSEPKYKITAMKDGYFHEVKSIIDYDQLLESGTFYIVLPENPLWVATTTSNATNQWVNLIVSQEISDADMWQRIVDAVTKRFQDLKQHDYASGYLATVPKIKSFNTDRGTLLLRSKFVATVMERDPLTYRLKIISEGSSDSGIKWGSYSRVFKEDAELVKELMSRFHAY